MRLLHLTSRRSLRDRCHFGVSCEPQIDLATTNAVKAAEKESKKGNIHLMDIETASNANPVQQKKQAR